MNDLKLEAKNDRTVDQYWQVPIAVAVATSFQIWLGYLLLLVSELWVLD